MSTDTLSVGVLGYGFMGKAHANALGRLPLFFPDAPDVSLDVLCGRDAEAAREAADRFGFADVETDWRDAIERVDVFYDLGPNDVHVEPSIHALEAGVHVLCEKPLAPTLDGAERMADAAAESDAVAATGFNYRYVPAIEYARRLIADGVLGDVRHVRARYLQDWLVDPDAPWSWRLDAESAGTGALGDLGAHSIDLVQFLVDDVTAVSGHRTTFVDERPDDDGTSRPVTVDDAFSAQAELANGATATFEATRCATGHKNTNAIEVEGTEGAVRFDLERLNELDVLRGDDRGFETVLVTDPEDPYVEHWWPPGHTIGWEHTFVHENAAFLRAAADGEDYDPGFDTGRDVQRVVDAIQRSDERREWVSL
ncbi:putative dehydrogenase [Halarchaeum rubridurum]|uniref:Oxidoreductase n=1 Tax=Halarchaeum rubridurum TaxID=489911 RepID=A0A830FYJ8_9EURY|nr:Gfo/Idh/MocA family oxidoreductase [Halarchaeum rubridurum]MBP1954820.1 putative dehydrogenase [Halarchaeum rubridurum]GGM59999.1 oxidoreductase [Halarchaeum rubridurum]